jgi:hypothetical protein
MHNNVQKATVYLLLIMVDNGFLCTPAISSFTLLWIVQVLPCAIVGFGQRFIKQACANLAAM